jgi:Tfp pilus assembly protein PilF
MITILFAVLFPPVLRRSAAWAGPLVMLVAATGCTLLPGSQSVSFHEHRVDRDASTSQKMEEKRDHAEFLAAHQRWMQQDLPGCREQLESLLARNPKHCDARLLLADVLMSTQQPQAALVQVQEALKYHADNADVQYAMGLTLDLNGRPDEALAYYERASKVAPNNEAYTLSYRTARDAAARRKTQTAGAAGLRSPVGSQGTPPAEPAHLPNPAQPIPAAKPASSLTAASEAKPVPKAVLAQPESIDITGCGNSKGDSQAVKHCGGSTAIVKADPFASAKGCADSAGSAGNDRAAGFLERGQDELTAGSPRLAVALFRKAAECDPQNPQIPIAAATYALKHNEPQMAAEILAPAAGSFPNSAAVSRCLGIAHLRSGDFSASQKDLEHALLLDKSSALSYFLMGCTLTKLGQLEAADVNFRQAEILDPRYAVRH